MAEMILPKIGESAIAGQRAGQQFQRGQIQNQLLQQNVQANQFNQETARKRRPFEIEKLKQINESGGLKNMQTILKNDAALLNAVLQLPPSQQANGFQAISERLDPKTVEMMGGQFDPGKAGLIRDTAISSVKAADDLYGKTMKVLDEKGNVVFVDIDKKGKMTLNKSKFKPIPKKGITITNADGSTVQIGGSDIKQSLAKPVLKKQQESIIKSQVALANLAVIEAKINPDFFTYGAQLSQKYGSVKEKLGFKLDPEHKAFIQARREFRNEVEQEFNQYRKEITGAAAAIQELEMIRDSFINMDLSHSEFQAAFSQYKAQRLRAIRISRKLLREGVQIGTKEYTKQHNKLFVIAGDDDLDTRGDELSESGLSDQEVMKQLKSEGYL